MASEMIRKIRQTEQEAEEIVEHAEREAEKIVSEAISGANDLRIESANRDKEHQMAIENSARKKAEKTGETFEIQANEAVEKLSKTAEEKRSSVVLNAINLLLED